MSKARSSVSRSVAAHAILIAYTVIALFPVVMTIINSFKSRGAIFRNPMQPPLPGTFDLVGYTTVLGQGDFLGFPIPAWIGLFAYLAGSLVLNLTAFGRTVLAVGGNEDATRLMGLPTTRVKAAVYILSGALAGLAGVILAAQFGAGQPIEGVGWELFAIAAVVVGGTLLTGGVGSVGSTLAGVLLLGLIFNILNFENGLGWISLSAYWQSVIRGAFLLLVVAIQARLSMRTEEPA